MRWWTFFILAYVIVAVQLGLSGYANWGRIAPNLVLPAAVFIAINARRDEALLGALLLGLMQDLFTQNPLGLYAFAYALAGLFVVGTSAAARRDHPLSHLALTLGAALVVNAVVWFNEWVHPKLHGEASSAPSIWLALAGALYTAMLGVLVLGALSRLKKVFNFKGGRSSMVGRHSGAVR
jgi:rod shape-determining protein MreD